VRTASAASSYLSLVPAGSVVSLRDAFTGQEDQAPDFGIPYTDFGARHYSPALSRWVVPDPLGEKYYDVSPYAYCENNPLSFIDPDGKGPETLWDLANVAMDVTSWVMWTKKLDKSAYNLSGAVAPCHRMKKCREFFISWHPIGQNAGKHCHEMKEYGCFFISWRETETRPGNNKGEILPAETDEDA